MTRPGFTFASILFAATIAAAAPPTVPASLPYQALLLDGLGQPRTGNLDLTVRIYDALIGGTLVYKQSFPSVALSDGVFNVQLGPSGEASDAPSNPLTTDLATALGGDAGATAPVRFVELTVGGDGPIARTQILASAYALRAARAATADSAATATTVGGFSAQYITQFFTYSLADGGNPPNTDPREGLADADGDGIANFVDPDNDNDGISDVAELGGGSDINLVTPTITAITPNTGPDDASTPVTVTGTSFQPGLTFTIGSQSPPVSSVTPTSFQAAVAPQPAGAVGIGVALPNGQTATRTNAFTFFTPPPPPPPTLYPHPHGVTLGTSAGYQLAVQPGTTQVALAGYQQYGVGDATGTLAVHSLASRGAAGQLAVAFDATGRLSALRCRAVGITCVVEVLTDTNADDNLEDETGVAIETLNGSAVIESAQLARNPNGGWVAAYIRRTFSPIAVVANDRNGDGDFADAAEISAIGTAGTGGTANRSALAVDALGHVAYAYWQSATGVRIAWDRNADGDFADTIGGNPESFLLASSDLNGFDLAFDAAGHLAATYDTEGGQVLARDLDDDGDFADVGETLAIGTPGSQVAAAAGQPLALAFGGELRLDENGDGDFADPGEQWLLDGGSMGTSGELVLNGGNRVIAVAGSNLYVGQTDVP